MSVQAFEIPLIPQQSQQLTVSLSGVLYTLTARWNDASQAWTLDIADGNGNAILTSIPLVTGCNLLGQYAYLGIPGRFIVQTDNNPSAVPMFTNLGTTAHLFYVIVQ